MRKRTREHKIRGTGAHDFLFYYFLVQGFSIGINVTNAVFTGRSSFFLTRVEAEKLMESSVFRESTAVGLWVVQIWNVGWLRDPHRQCVARRNFLTLLHRLLDRLLDQEEFGSLCELTAIFLSPSPDFDLTSFFGPQVAEMRLWLCYLAIPLYVCGYVLLGFAFQNHM